MGYFIILALYCSFYIFLQLQHVVEAFVVAVFGDKVIVEAAFDDFAFVGYVYSLI